jgi:quercetin dioxygenase-like cupin family protein
MTRRLRVVLLGAALALVVLAAGPPLVSAITANLLVTAKLRESVNVNNDGIKLKTRRATDVHVQEVTFEPGDFVDWHNHPGFALIAVKSGEMTFLDPDCTAHEIGPGEAFVESGGPTYAVNEGIEPAHFYITYVVPRRSERTVPTDPPPCATEEDEKHDD